MWKDMNMKTENSTWGMQNINLCRYTKRTMCNHGQSGGNGGAEDPQLLKLKPKIHITLSKS
jgi:hypothetical protein